MHHDGADGLLRALVAIVDGPVGVQSIGVTLSSGGLLVSGDLVGAAAFGEAFREGLIAGAPSDAWASGLRGVFDEAADAAAPVESEAEPPPEQEVLYIHLRDVTFWSPGGGSMRTGAGVWWRAKLSSVDGFSLGALRP